MKRLSTRRRFLKTMAAGLIAAGSPTVSFAEIIILKSHTPPENYESHIKDYLHKMHDFNAYHQNDILLNQTQRPLLKSTLARLKRLQRTVGYGNFHLMGLDDAIKLSRNYSRIGNFKRAELNFLEMIFFEDAAKYGFQGSKTLQQITDKINMKNTVKISNTGNYLYSGAPLNTYREIKKTMGEKVVLTSGIRSIVKQFLLFLNKADTNDANLSLASRSLAPPGYSYHGIGDFDVGQKGFGYDNFTERFTTTEVFKKLKNLNYINLRYPADNTLGVRFEPWHIKVYNKS